MTRPHQLFAPVMRPRLYPLRSSYGARHRPQRSLPSQKGETSTMLSAVRETSSESPKRSARYQVMLVGLLSLNFGILFFDRNALNFLMPFVQPDLGLSNIEVGLLASALSLTWAISGFLVGRLSDTTGQRKSIIIVATCAFCLCSFVSGIASSFLMLLGARLLMGFSEGGVLPITHAIIADEVAPERRGVAMGVAQNLGSNLLGSTAAPLLLVAIAAWWGWRSAFYFAAVPGLVTAALIWLLVKDPVRDTVTHAVKATRMTAREAFGVRNIRLCAIISVLLVAYLVVCWAFMPLFLTQKRGFDPDVMSWLMATLGISAGIGSFLVPGISDLVGRKPVMIAVPFVGMVLPLGAMYFDGPTWMLAGIFFIGWALNGIFPMFMATIPSESVAPQHMATVLGLVMGTGEVLGGVFSPFIAGAAADEWGLDAPLYIMVFLCVLAGFLAMGLKETAPRILARREALVARASTA
jgi:ACS family hexuronate transporter-like MFS transporter